MPPIHGYRKDARKCVFYGIDRLPGPVYIGTQPRTGPNMASLKTLAPAKINLSLKVGARRADGYHEIESIVAFAGIGDALSLTPGGKLTLEVDGPTAEAAGPDQNNLVLKAARTLAGKIKKLKTGKFKLTKNLPSGAGLGGGSADAAAALRLLAKLNALKSKDPRMIEAAAETGADVLVCLEGKARLISGIGEILSKPLKIPVLPAVLIYPGVPVPTPFVYRALDAQGDKPAELDADVKSIPLTKRKFLDYVLRQSNDLAKPARSITPLIASAEELIDETGDAVMIRMTGSGSAVFGIYETKSMAEQSAELMREERPHWWIRTTTLR
jgi:4-diphosphocytidyl-2-C-methyl-D-erythritol kinase